MLSFRPSFAYKVNALKGKAIRLQLLVCHFLPIAPPLSHFTCHCAVVHARNITPIPSHSSCTKERQNRTNRIVYKLAIYVRQSSCLLVKLQSWRICVFYTRQGSVRNISVAMLKAFSARLCVTYLVGLKSGSC
jgi:hypothetical protein